MSVAAPAQIVVVTAGLSTPSSTRMLADRLSAATVDALAARDRASEVTTIELRDVAHDLTDNLLTGFAAAPLQSVIDTVVSADALILVTPIFATSYSGLTKMFLDVLDPAALTGMPVLLAANAGTARHSLAIDYALRPVLTYLHADPVPTGVFAASSDWGAKADSVAPLAARVSRGADELAEAVVRGRRRVVAPAPERSTVADFDPAAGGAAGDFATNFGHLLGGLSER